MAVTSVVKRLRNGAVMAEAAKLWIHPNDLVVDITYGRGAFWTEYQPARFVAHDLALDGVDFRSLPEDDASVDVVVFDPPYTAQGGRATSTIPDFLDRYGLMDVPKTHAGVVELMQAGAKEAARVLRPRGRLLIKCADYITGGRFRTGHVDAVLAARAAGLEQVDEFIHARGMGPNRPIDPQLHSRRTHSFLCVFQAPPVRLHRRDIDLERG